ncbi:MAG TPA: rhodanese-like domain-containing protein [Cyclobacteriaceae bacterium]|jgi:rhodanese-related sulfurtransferase|nr:rhodanese-like domain-containing protein [Cyclobacteriaceae bacterium]
MKEISPAELQLRLEQGEPPHLIDVREPYEHEEFNIGGQNIPVSQLPFHIEEIRQLTDREIILYCQSGNRSGLAQQLLASQFGITNTINLKGGMKAWRGME